MGNKLLTLCPADFYDEKGFDEAYEVDEGNYLGTGKFAVVHLCWRRQNPEKRYALKVINTRIGDMASLNRIREEINILQVLGSNSGLVSLVDVDETLPGSIRLVLELCEGGELYDRIQQKQYYPEQEAKLTCNNLLEAVAYIHSRGIMHRDLKPENILLASKVSNTNIKISDFGLAKISKDFPHRLPRSHSICGSDFYLAPEVIKQEEYGREIDIWACGIITYVLLSGSLPFFHQVLHKLYRQIVERDMSFPKESWSNVSKGALDFILRMLQVRAGDRLTADQAMTHPWLRGATSGSSFGSFDHHNLGGGNLLSAGGSTQSHYGALSSANPLEHAHKVNSKGPERGTPTSTPSSFGQSRGSPMAGYPPQAQVYGGAAPVATQPYGRPPVYANGAYPGGAAYYQQ